MIGWQLQRSNELVLKEFLVAETGIKAERLTQGKEKLSEVDKFYERSSL